MPILSFQCPSCGAPLIPRGKAVVISCSHCLTSVVVPEGLRQESEVVQWTTLLYDNFASNDNNWWVGIESDEYFDPLSCSIDDGRFRWEAQVTGSVGIAKSWLKNYQVSDFHLIANAKHVRGNRENSSWGVMFRVQDQHNNYWFCIKDSSFFQSW